MLLQAQSSRRWRLLDLLKPPSLATQPSGSSSSSGASPYQQQQQHCIPRATSNALPGIWSDLLSSHPCAQVVQCQQQQQQSSWRWARAQGAPVALLFSLYETPPWLITDTASWGSGEALLLQQMTLTLAEALKLRSHSSHRLVMGPNGRRGSFWL